MKFLMDSDLVERLKLISGVYGNGETGTSSFLSKVHTL